MTDATYLGEHPATMRMADVLDEYIVLRMRAFDPEWPHVFDWSKLDQDESTRFSELSEELNTRCPHRRTS